MITSKDTNYEFNQAYKKVKEAKTIQEVGEILIKLIQVVSKVILGVRRNQIKIMEKLEVEKDIPMEKKVDSNETPKEEKE